MEQDPTSAPLPDQPLTPPELVSTPPLPPVKTKRQSRPWLRIVGSLPVLVGLGLLLLWWQYQNIYDAVHLYGYSAPADIAQLATQDTMTPSARRVYYVNHPALKTQTTFSQFCTTGTEQTVVLGCYKSRQQGIYVLKVTNAELQGIEQVTAAHEMLHAEYDRLSSSERTKVDGELQDFYEHQLTDQTIKQTIASYKKTEPNDIVNEMHSVFGTEVANLPPALEQYYTRYFTDRHKITGFYAQYNEAFTGRQAQVKQDDATLASQKTQIDQLQASVQQQAKTLQDRRSALNAYKTAGNITAYNAGVGSFNALVDTYNSDIQRLQQLITSYNQLVAERNSIALEEAQLVQAISAPKAIQPAP